MIKLKCDSVDLIAVLLKWMEETMTQGVIKHEIKLQKSVISIGVIVFGLCANAFVPAFNVKSALAELDDGDSLKVEIINTGQYDTIPSDCYSGYN